MNIRSRKTELRGRGSSDEMEIKMRLLQSISSSVTLALRPAFVNFKCCVYKISVSVMSSMSTYVLIPHTVEMHVFKRLV